MLKDLKLKNHKKKSGSIMLYTLMFLGCILFLGTYLTKIELNSLKYINEQYQRFNREAIINNGREKLLMDLYNYLQSKNNKHIDFKELLDKELEFKKSLKVKNINKERNMVLYYKNNIVNIDYEYMDNFYMHEKYELICIGDKFFLKNMNNNISNEENNY